MMFFQFDVFMDVLSVTSVGDHGYYEGRVDSREGWFPSNSVQEVRMRRGE